IKEKDYQSYRDSQLKIRNKKLEESRDRDLSHRAAVEERRKRLEQQDQERKEAILRRTRQRSESAREKRRSWTPGISMGHLPTDPNDRRHSSEQLSPDKSHGVPTISSPTKRLSSSVCNVASSGSSMSKRLSMSSTALNRARTPSPIHLIRLRGADPDELYAVYDTSSASDYKREARFLSASTTSTGGVHKPKGFASTSHPSRLITPRPKRWRASSPFKHAKSTTQTDSLRPHSSYSDLGTPRSSYGSKNVQLRSRSLDRRMPTSQNHESISRRPPSPGTTPKTSTPRTNKPGTPHTASPGQTARPSRPRAHSADRVMHKSAPETRRTTTTRPTQLAVNKTTAPPIKKSIVPAATERKPSTPSPSKTSASLKTSLATKPTTPRSMSTTPRTTASRTASAKPSVSKTTEVKMKASPSATRTRPAPKATKPVKEEKEVAKEEKVTRKPEITKEKQTREGA
uniref:Mucin-5AC-like n=1 Tax=Saccoglossus kowalevskii TaxID=10224 RepID=A0ABM0MXG3_SACKO